MAYVVVRADVIIVVGARRYVHKVFSFEGIDVPLLVSPSACTDFDLTGALAHDLIDCALGCVGIGRTMHEPRPSGSAGQILWPAATLLAGYLAANPRWATGCSCALELGAGLGLVGCVAARLCRALLTDHNADVLSVLRRNAALNSHQHGVSCAAGLLLSTGPLLYTRM